MTFIFTRTVTVTIQLTCGSVMHSYGQTSWAPSFGSTTKAYNLEAGVLQDICSFSFRNLSHCSQFLNVPHREIEGLSLLFNYRGLMLGCAERVDVHMGSCAWLLFVF